MAIALVAGVGNLLPELFADAFVVFTAFQPAGAVAAGTLQALPDGGNHFLILVQSDSHVQHILSYRYYKANPGYVKEYGGIV